jgi:hypothetical protein
LVAVFVGLNIYIPFHEPEPDAHFGFWGALLSQEALASKVIAPVLILIEAVLINALFNRNEFMERNTYIPSLIYVTVMSVFHSFYFLNGFAVAQLCIILALYQLYQLYQNEDGRRRVFNTGFWLGVACSFHPILVLLILVGFWLIWVIRPFVLRESILFLVGFLIPLFYGGFFARWTGNAIESQDITSTGTALNIEDVLALSVLTFILILLTLRGLATKVQQSSIRLKKLFRILLIFIVFSVLLTVVEYFVFTKKEALAMTFIPLAFVIPYAFGLKHLQKTATVTYYVLLVFTIGRFFFPLAYIMPL